MKSLYKEKHSGIQGVNPNNLQAFLPAPMLTTIDQWRDKDKNTQIDMAVLDFSKAFDTVPHKRLLGKLSFCGVKGDILSWVQAFLEDRERKVVEDGRSSSSEAVFRRARSSDLYYSYYILMICHLLFLRKCASSRTTASCIDPSALSRTRLQCNATWTRWSGGAIHGAWGSMLRSVRLWR